MTKNFQLEESEYEFCHDFVKKSKESLRAIILLLLNKGMSNIDIANLLDIHPNTVSRIKNKYLKEDLNVALFDKQRSGQPQKYGDREEAEIIALACSNPPQGRKSWSLRLITETLKDQENFKTINRESVRLVLKKATQSRGKGKCGALLK
jgi:transposase